MGILFWLRALRGGFSNDDCSAFDLSAGQVAAGTFIFARPSTLSCNNLTSFSATKVSAALIRTLAQGWSQMETTGSSYGWH